MAQRKTMVAMTGGAARHAPPPKSVEIWFLATIHSKVGDQIDALKFSGRPDMRFVATGIPTSKQNSDFQWPAVRKFMIRSMPWRVGHEPVSTTVESGVYSRSPNFISQLPAVGRSINRLIPQHFRADPVTAENGMEVTYQATKFQFQICKKVGDHFDLIDFWSTLYASLTLGSCISPPIINLVDGSVQKL